MVKQRFVDVFDGSNVFIQRVPYTLLLLLLLSLHYYYYYVLERFG